MTIRLREVILKKNDDSMDSVQRGEWKEDNEILGIVTAPHRVEEEEAREEQGKQMHQKAEAKQTILETFFMFCR